MGSAGRDCWIFAVGTYAGRRRVPILRPPALPAPEDTKSLDRSRRRGVERSVKLRSRSSPASPTLPVCPIPALDGQPAPAGWLVR